MASLLPQDNVPLAKPPLSSSSNSPSNNPLFPMSKTSKEKSKLVADESDDDLFMVPDMEAQKTIHELLDKKDDEKEMNNNSQEISKNEVTVIQPKRKRGRNAVDKEYRRLKRLLRNRVSAQQARERKKVYVNDLEWRAQELQDHNFKLEEKISTLLNENTMLRKILMNTRPKLDECAENKSLIDGGDRPSSDIH